MYKRIIVFIITGILFYSCSNSRNLNTNLENQADVVYVNAVKAERELYENELNSFGTITYKLKNDVTSLVSGTIFYFPVKDGDFVTKGQVIAKLRNVQLEIQKEQYLSNVNSSKASYDIAKAQYSEDLLNVESRLLSLDKAGLNIKQKELELELLKKTVNNQEELHKIGGVTDSSIEHQRLQIKSSETEIEILKKELEISRLGLRQEDLVNNGIVPSNDKEEFKKQIIELNTRTSSAQLAAADAALKAAEQQLNSVNKLIEELSIKAPVSGILGTKYYEPGEYVQENEKLCTIIDVSSVYAVVNVQENDIVDFSIGTPVYIEIPSIKEVINAKVSEISPIADSQSGNFSIKINLRNSKNSIKPGMFLKCKIQRSVPEKLVRIPETALFSEDQDTAKIFCAVNNFSVQKTIKIHAKKDGNVWVADGIKEGEFVINNPSALLKNGQKIKIMSGLTE